MKRGHFILGFIIGGLSALLLTPKTGEESRADLKKSINAISGLTQKEMRDKVIEAYNNFKETVNGFDSDALKDSTKDKIAEMEKQLMTLFEEIKNNNQVVFLEDQVNAVVRKVNITLAELKAKAKDDKAASDDLINKEISDVTAEIDDIINSLSSD